MKTKNFGWDELFQQFINLPEQIKWRVLPVVADLHHPIATRWWITPNHYGCLYAVAIAAATGRPLEELDTMVGFDSVWRGVFGLSNSAISKGMQLWDSSSRSQRIRFRKRIAAYVEQERNRQQRALIVEIEAMERCNAEPLHDPEVVSV